MKNPKIFFIITLFYLSSCQLLPDATKWDVTVTSQDGSSIIKVVKGKYTTLLLNLTKQETEIQTSNQFVPSSTTIQLQQDSLGVFQTNQKEYVIDTSESNIYVVYLGVSCNSNLENGEYTLTFENTPNSMSDSFLIFKSFKVEFINDPTQNLIDITPVITELPKNSKALFKLNYEPKNVDDIKMIFHTDGGNDYSYVKTLLFKKINEKTSSIIEGGFNEYVGEYGVYKYEEGKTLHHYTIEIDNKCYTTSLGNVFEFSTVDQEIEPLNKNAIVKSFHQIESKDPGAIEVSFNVPSFVTVIAGLIFDDQFGDIKDIINMVEKEKIKYSKTFITEQQDNFILKFSNLQRKTKYRLIIVIKNLSINDETNYITITVGYFKGADIVKSLYPRLVNDFPAQCATWTFETEDLKDFAKKAEQYCKYIFIGAATNTKGFFEGCTKCEQVNSINNNPNQIVICAYTKDNCKNKFEGDPIALFKQFVDDLSTGEKINTILSLENLVVTDYKIEIDNIEPKKEKIIAVLANKAENKELLFNVTSHLEQAIECNYKKNLNRNIRNRWISPENLKERSLIIPPGKTETFIATLPNPKPDNKTYNIYLDCYYLPNFNYQFFSTGPFVAGTFLFTDVETPKMEPKEDIDCLSTDNIGNLQCKVKEQPNTNITFESGVPEVFENASDDAEDLSRLSIGKQYLMVDFAFSNFKETNPEQNLPSGQAILNSIERALELAKQMEQFNCTEMNVKTCREYKKGMQMKVVNFFKNFFVCDKMMEMFIQLEEYKSFEEALKTFLLLIETATANYDSMNQNDTDYFLNLIECLFNNFDSIWQRFNETSGKTQEELVIIKADLTQMILDAVANLGEANKYDEADQYHEQKVTKGKLIVNEKTKKIKQNIKKAVKMLWGKGSGKWETENFIVNLTINMEVQSKTQLRGIKTTSQEEITYFDMNKYGIKVGLYVNTLMKEFNAKYAEIILYKKYPLLSITNNIVSNTFVSISLYDVAEQEIPIKDIPKEFLPVILFEQSKNNFPKCVYYHEKNEALQNDGVSAEVRDGYITCKVTHLTDFSVADSSALGGGMAWWGILLICIAVIVVLGGGFLLWRRMNGKGLSSGMTESLKV